MAKDTSKDDGKQDFPDEKYPEDYSEATSDTDKPEIDNSDEDTKEEKANPLIEVKVSTDRVETWHRRKINMSGDLDESGLSAGEMFQLNGEKYEVLAGDTRLRVEPLKKDKVGKKQAPKKR